MEGCSIRRRRRRRPRDERGGAISLWVVLMVPVSAFAAVAAMAGPQRFAATSTVQEAANDLAAFAVAWRDGQRISQGPLISFPSDCTSRTDEQHEKIAILRQSIGRLSAPLANGPDDTAFNNFRSSLNDRQNEFEDLLGEFKQPSPQRLGVYVPPDPPHPDDPEFETLNEEYMQANSENQEANQAVVDTLGTRLEALVRWLDGWDESCEVLLEALAGDLGDLGISFGDLRGSYSDSLNSSALTEGACSDPLYTTRYDCEANLYTWTANNSQFAVPCRTGEETVVFDGVHVAVTADWLYAGWAAAQVWPDGVSMAAESTGRLTQRDSASTYLACGSQLVVFDSQGRPIWSGPDPVPDSRELVQSVRRSTLSG